MWVRTKVAFLNYNQEHLHIVFLLNTLKKSLVGMASYAPDKLYTALTLDILYSAVYSVHCTVHSVQCTMYRVQCKVNSVQCTVYSIQCTVYSV